MKILQTEIIHRKYPETQWEYRAVSLRVLDEGKLKDINYGKGHDKNRQFEGVEVYSGENYIVGSKAKSHSNRYSMNKIPKKYQVLVREAMQIHKTAAWSSAKRVDRN